MNFATFDSIMEIVDVHNKQQKPQDKTFVTPQLNYQTINTYTLISTVICHMLNTILVVLKSHGLRYQKLSEN